MKFVVDGASVYGATTAFPEFPRSKNMFLEVLQINGTMLGAEISLQPFFSVVFID